MIGCAIKLFFFVIIMVFTLILIGYMMGTADAGMCRLRWAPQSDAAGFRVYRGIQLLADTTESRVTVELPSDQASTVFVVAYRGALVSEPSDTLTVIPVTPLSSTDLQTWKSHEPFYVKLEPKGFFRFSYPTP